VKVRVLPDKSGVDLKNVKMSLNPFCEIAVGKRQKMRFLLLADFLLFSSFSRGGCTAEREENRF
jgi:hypothetical protein